MLLALLFSCWSSGSALEAQSLRHPERVQIKPATAPGPADALRIWGGLQAGPNGDIQVINADGTITGSTGIADGTITFAKWASNGCADGNVPIYSVGALAWECGTASGGGLNAADNATISGSWRFSTNTLFGDLTTPQQLIHIYESGAAAGLRLEHGGVAWWDLTASNTALTTSTGAGTVSTLTPTGLGILKTPATALDVNGTATVTGLAVNGTVASHLIPSLPDTYDLGSSEKLWRQGFLSQLNAVLFAEQTATLLGGYTIIAKNAGSFAHEVASGDVVVDFGQTMTPGQFVLVRAHDIAGTIRAEYFQVGALSAGTTYLVTRDLAGTSSPNPAWAESTPYMVLGTVGDGRIELNAYNTPKISFITQGGSYNAQTESLRLGALDGMTGVPAGKFGLYVGDTSSAGLSFYDSTLLVRGTVNATAGWFGNSSAQGVAIDATGLAVGATGAIRNGSTTYTTGSGYFLGADAGTQKFRVGSTSTYMRWTGTALEIAASSLTGNGSGLTSIDGGNITAGTVTTSQIATGTIAAIDIAAAAITTDKLAVGGYGAALNSDAGTSDLTAWSRGGASLPLLGTVSDGKVGTSTLRGLADSSAYNLYPRPIAVDPTKTYRFKVWARSSGLPAADGLFYGGVYLQDSAGAVLDSDGIGPPDGSLWFYCVGQTITAAWTEFSCPFGAGTAKAFPAAAATMFPLVLFNYGGTVGYHEIQDIRIEEMVPGTLIKDGAITTDKITANAITSTHIQAGTIVASDIAANTITASQIAAGTITTVEIGANSITTLLLDAQAVTAAKIATGTITATQIAAGTITATEIATGTITADRIQSGTITATQIQSGSITADRLDVSDLSAISADLGTVTAGTINGVSINGGTITGGSSNQVTISSSGISIASAGGYDATRGYRFDSSDDGLFKYGGTIGLFGADDLLIDFSDIIELNGATVNIVSSNIRMASLPGTGGYVCVDGSGYLYTSASGC